MPARLGSGENSCWLASGHLHEVSLHEHERSERDGGRIGEREGGRKSERERNRGRIGEREREGGREGERRGE